MTANPGWWPRAVSAAARCATSARICLDSATPSISCAVMGGAPGVGSEMKEAAELQRPPVMLGGSGLLVGRRTERDLEQVGHGVGVQLLHDVGAMRLHRLDADAQVVGDLLVQAAGDDALEHLGLAGGEAGGAG